MQHVDIDDQDPLGPPAQREPVREYVSRAACMGLCCVLLLVVALESEVLSQVLGRRNTLHYYWSLTSN